MTCRSATLPRADPSIRAVDGGEVQQRVVHPGFLFVENHDIDGLAIQALQFCLGAQMTGPLHPQFVLDHLVSFSQLKPPLDRFQIFKPRRRFIRQAVSVRDAGGEEEDSQPDAGREGQSNNSCGDPFAIHPIVFGS